MGKRLVRNRYLTLFIQLRQRRNDQGRDQGALLSHHGVCGELPEGGGVPEYPLQRQGEEQAHL